MKTTWGRLRPQLPKIVIGSLILVTILSSKTISFSPTDRQVLQDYQPSGSGYNGLRQSLPKLLQTYGISRSISVVEEALREQTISMDDCHNLLHIVGHLAYQEYPGDLSKLAGYDSRSCTASFQHGVEAQIVISGSDKVRTLQRFCEQLQIVHPGVTCYHGSGHAFMETLGDPQQALTHCDELANETVKDLSDCYRGVFSELGNQAGGFDTDSGYFIPATQLAQLNDTHPYLYCQHFAEVYRDSCYSQLTKLLFRTDDVSGSLQKCLEASLTADIQATCIRIIAGISSRITLSTQSYVDPPPLVFTLSPSLKKSYLDGAYESFIGFTETGIKRDWGPTCQKFSGADLTYCQSKVQHNQ